MKINANKFVSASYDLYVGGSDGTPAEIMETATVEKPLSFIFGTGMMLEAFEKNLSGLGVDDTFDFELTAEEAYGDYDETHVVAIPRSVFEVDGKIDTEVIFENNTVPMMDQAGNRMNGTVVSVSDTEVTMDFNHPLAGEMLHFVGKVLVVRESTPEEVQQFLGGGGCNCSSGGCGDGGCGDGGCGDHEGGCGDGGCGDGGCGCGH